MAQFSYSAFKESGEVFQGLLEADNPEGVEDALRKQGLIPLKIKSRTYWMSTLASIGSNKVLPEDVMMFTRQLRSLLAAGIPILKALSVIQKQTNSHSLKAIIEKVLADLEGGSDLSSAIERHSKIFSDFYVSTLIAGEASGNLPEVLGRLASYLEFEEKVKRDIKSALRYPILVIAGLFSSAMLFTVFVIPKFAKIFSSFHLELPLASRIVFQTSTFLREHVVVIGIFLLACFLALKFHRNSPSGKIFWDKFKLKIPVFGDLFKKVILFRFAWMMRMMYQSGLSIIKGLEVVSRTVDNALYKQELENAIKQVESGDPLSRYLETSSCFPPMIVHMISSGEQSGALDQMLDEIANYYDTELSYRIRNLTVLIEPIVTVFLAAGVLVLALAVFLPMWDLVKIIRQ